MTCFALDGKIRDFLKTIWDNKNECICSYLVLYTSWNETYEAWKHAIINPTEIFEIELYCLFFIYSMQT